MKNFKFSIIVVALALFYSAATAQTSKPTKNIPAAEHYVGGQDSLYSFINKNITYPGAAKRNRIQGECIVNLIINADGTATDYHLVKNVGAGCGEEATRVVKLLKFKAPGYRVQTSIPVIFKL